MTGLRTRPILQSLDMNISETIWRWAVLMLAEVLNLSARAAETVLWGQPRWVAHLRLMEANLREGAGRAAGEPHDNGSGASDVPDTLSARDMVKSYAILNRALRDMEARGLALDDALVERMKNDWSTGSIVGYLQTCDTQLKQSAAETLNAAAAILGAQAEGPAGNTGLAGPGEGNGSARPNPTRAAPGSVAAKRRATAGAERRKDLAS